MRLGLTPFIAFTVASLAACASSSRPPMNPAPTTGAAHRPVAYPVLESHAFAHAVANGTRTRTGVPGPHYWQQWSKYTISATLDSATRRVSGREHIHYENHSPDSLGFLAIHVDQNLFAPGNSRLGQLTLPPGSKGMEITSVSLNGRPVVHDVSGDSATGYFFDETRMGINVGHRVAPGDSAEIDVTWSFIVPGEESPREGTDGDVWMIAYWYPRMAVRDDVTGWAADPYLGVGEFYDGYADYDFSLTVPAGWLVAATGTLVNAADVLSAQTRSRLALAHTADTVVHVVSDADRGANRATLAGTNGMLTWHFTAHDVRDVDFATSPSYLWDATHALVGDANGDGTADTSEIDAFYRPSRRDWDWGHAARDARYSIEFLSKYLWPYPYPHATAADGVVGCSGMEYPMLTCIGGQRDTLGLFSVVVHELGHMWFPMQVGSDERNFAWMDEGLTRFNQIQGMQAFYPGFDRATPTFKRYLALAGTDGEVPLMRPADQYPLGTSAYSVATYEKMATNMMMLRELLGDSTFMRAYREYGRRWTGKHPYPWDFWNTFSQVSGRNLDWFWREWWFETWTLDQGIVSAEPSGGNTMVTVVNRGLAVMPTRIAVTRTNGSIARYEIPVETWLAGVDTVHLDVGANVGKVEIDPAHMFPYVDRSQLIWPQPPAPASH